MKVAVACGGTGGHLFPGLATAEELVRRGHEVTVWVAGKAAEAPALAGWAGRVVRLHARGFDSRLNWRAVGSAWTLWKATAEARRRMRAERPDVLLAMGSFASVAPALAAWRLNVPLVLHEANVIPGRAIRLLSPAAKAVAISFDATTFYLKRARVVLTGMPLRRPLVEAAEHAHARSFDGRPPTVLVMGGSAGARRLNQEVPPAVVEAAKRVPGLRVIHLAGPGNEREVEAVYASGGVEARVFAFADDMASLYREADFAVCRAGASTCAELSAFGLPALLVPYPHAIANHQFENARALERAGAADVVADEDLTASWLTEYLATRLHDAARRERMSRAMRTRAPLRAAEALAELVISSAS